MLTNLKKYLLSAAFCLAAASSPIVSVAADTDLCLATGYTLGYFNGVGNTEFQAKAALAKLESMRGTKFNNEPVQYEVFYNHTGSTAGATLLQDLAETFMQRAAEIDASGELGNRWEFFWESLTFDKPLTDKLTGFIPNISRFFSQLYTDIATKTMAALSSLLSNPPTEADYNEHNTRLDALAVQQQKLMLVAHSQGNLFMNHAYDHISPKVGEASVKAVHVAPASPTLRGDYLLADIDLVINSLRIQGAGSVPPINIILPVSVSDLSGHGLVETYLDPTRAARNLVDTMITTAMQALASPPTSGTPGAFSVTLTWDGLGDLDLHTFEPSGAHVYYESRAGDAGFLDVDNTIADGPEHYYVSCDPAVIQTGTYRMGINHFTNGAGRKATVQVSTSKGGTLLTKTVDVGAENGKDGNASPTPVLDVVVSKNEAGVYSFTAN